MLCFTVPELKVICIFGRMACIHLPFEIYLDFSIGKNFGFCFVHKLVVHLLMGSVVCMSKLHLL